MKPLACLALWAMLAVSVVAPASAQTAAPAAPAAIEVTNVKFNSVREGAGTWYEAAIEVQPKAGVAVDNKNFVNRVKVTLNLGVFSVKSPQGARVPDTYYRASAEAVAVEASGGKTTFRFYLPPELVKRDQITGEQKFYLVEVFVNGNALPLAKNNVHAATLSSVEAVDSFRSKVGGESGVNDGILIPQYLTPFAFDNSRPAPSFLRLENSR